MAEPLEKSANVIDFPISLESRLRVLETSGNLTYEAIDQTCADFLQPLILQAARVVAALKALQSEINLSDEPQIGLIETSREA